MKATPLSIPDVLLIEPEVFGDDRGFFFESFNQNKFEEAMGKKINFFLLTFCVVNKQINKLRNETEL